MIIKQTFFIPNYEQAQAICQSNETFYEKKVEINGVKVSVFNYRLAQFKDFQQPIASSSEITGFEMRGLTFVHEAEGTKRYLQLHKFFNLNQVPGYQLAEVEHLNVLKSQDKCDGSMIRFILINGELVAKTKMDFFNDQCVMAMGVVENNPKLKSFILETLDRGEAAIMELVSKFNQIVISYDKTELILLQIRDELTGEYKDIYQHSLVLKYGIKCAEVESSKSLMSYVERKEIEENIEGWVLTLENGQMLKVKTNWYIVRHGLLSEELVRENKIVELVLTDTLDDLIAQVDKDDIRRKYAEEIQAAIIKYLDKKANEIVAFKSKYQGDRKSFAMENHKHPLFPFAVKLIDYKGDEKDLAYNLIKQKTLQENLGLMNAKKFVLETLGVQLQLFEETFDNDN